MTEDLDRAEAHAELGRERWSAHRELHAGEKELDGQKWDGHNAHHESIARSLLEYKAQSNEWRGSLSDLRATFAAQAQVEILETRLNEFREELRGMIATEREERREQQAVRTGRTAGMSQTTSIIVATIGVAGTVLFAISLLLNLGGTP